MFQSRLSVPAVHACRTPDPSEPSAQLSLKIPSRISPFFVKIGPDARICGIMLPVYATRSASVQGPPVPSRIRFCLHPLLPLPTASHRQQLQCLQNKSFQPTFQCLCNIHNVVLWVNISDLCQWYCVINLSLVSTFFHFTHCF